MEFLTTPIEGLRVIKPTIFADSRGYFFESYNEQKYKENGIPDTFVQDNQSKSCKGVIRGLHFQKPPFAQAKIVRVIKGAVMDVAVDIRKKSPTYGQHYSVVLTEENQWQFYLPVGFAHGFVALEDDTVFAYKCSAFYNKASEGCILFNDKDLHIDWNIETPLISDKDILGENFKDFKSEF